MNTKGLYLLITYLSIFVIGSFVLLMVWYYTPTTQMASASGEAVVSAPQGPTFSDPAQETLFASGKEIFRNNCAACHNKNMKDNLTGPALGQYKESWADYPEEDLYNWIRNSQAMISEGHPKAVELWEQYKPVIMTSFANLTDEDVGAILFYIDEMAKI